MKKTWIDFVDFFVLFILALVFVMIVSTFVWPTPYRYHAAGTILVREHRITGTLEVFGVKPSGEFGWLKRSAR